MPIDPRSLPVSVQQLLREVPPASDNLVELRPAWEAFAGRVRAEAPYAIVEDGGETIYTGELSPGCQACKAGTWDCLFLTARCNLTCSFCCSPALRDEGDFFPLSAFGSEADQVLEHLHYAQPEGISFSGGEAFLEYGRLLALVDQVRREFPRAYLWMYTNGRLADGEKLGELGEAGIDEIRFNLAATGYTQADMLRRVAQAGRNIQTVTVEIPAIPRDAEKLLAALEIWSELGVRYLNLHELMYEPGSLSAEQPGPRVALHTPDGHHTEFDPHSRALTLRVMQTVQTRGLRLAVNDCSMQNKLRQVRGRQALMGRMVERLPISTEALGADGWLETVCAFAENGEFVLIHPRELETARSRYPGWRLIYLRRPAPLTVYEKKQWNIAEELENRR